MARRVSTAVLRRFYALRGAASIANAVGIRKDRANSLGFLAALGMTKGGHRNRTSSLTSLRFVRDDGRCGGKSGGDGTAFRLLLPVRRRRYFINGTVNTKSIKAQSANIDTISGKVLSAQNANISGTLTTNNMSITGNLGLGTNVPQEKLHVKEGNILVTNASNPTTGFEKSALIFDIVETSIPPFPATPPDRWGVEYTNSQTNGNGLNFWRCNSNNPHGKDPQGTSSYTSVLFLNNSDSNVGIGTTNPQAKLDVRGLLKAQNADIANKLTAKNAIIDTISGEDLTYQSGNFPRKLTAGIFNANSATINGTLYAKDTQINGLLCAKEIRVSIAGAPCWPDYVFGKDYNLMPLQELEQFVNKNQHLPNVPTATSVAENGIDLGEMNAILLKKMEEMTLYILDLQKQINELKQTK